MIGRISSAFALLALGLTLPARAQQQALSPSEVAKIREDVTAAVHTYYRLFTERNMKAVGERVYHVPTTFIGPEGVQIYATPAEVTARFEKSLQDLLKNGWDRSEFPKPAVCVLNANAAIASGTFYRYKKDGSVLSENGVTYWFAKAKDGWRILSFTGSPVGKTATCND
jgi:hypothetical protein